MEIEKAFTDLALWCKKYDVVISVMDGNLGFRFADPVSYNTRFFYSLTFDKYTNVVRQWDTVAISSDKES